MVVLFLVFMVWVAGELGLDVLLGAFAAGMVFRLFSAGAGEAEAEAVESKLIGLGFGFVVPVFFVVSGVTFDLDALTDNPLLLLAIPGILVLFVVVRGAPTALLHREMTGPDRRAMAVYLGTELPLVVVVTALALMSFLAGGHLPGRGRYGQNAPSASSQIESCIGKAWVRERDVHHPRDVRLTSNAEREADATAIQYLIANGTPVLIEYGPRARVIPQNVSYRY